ncbi:MAG TPA: hypothetical protein VKM55_10580 [Candidatus Lokiarchaeia archaeon]|nr:hypothetical protein [Candidatus Lokiarchaeia archaeon]
MNNKKKCILVLVCFTFACLASAAFAQGSNGRTVENAFDSLIGSNDMPSSNSELFSEYSSHGTGWDFVGINGWTAMGAQNNPYLVDINGVWQGNWDASVSPGSGSWWALPGGQNGSWNELQLQAMAGTTNHYSSIAIGCVGSTEYWEIDFNNDGHVGVWNGNSSVVDKFAYSASTWYYFKIWWNVAMNNYFFYESTDNSSFTMYGIYSYNGNPLSALTKIGVYAQAVTSTIYSLEETNMYVFYNSNIGQPYLPSSDPSNPFTIAMNTTIYTNPGSWINYSPGQKFYYKVDLQESKFYLLEYPSVIDVDFNLVSADGSDIIYHNSNYSNWNGSMIIRPSKTEYYNMTITTIGGGGIGGLSAGIYLIPKLTTSGVPAYIDGGNVKSASWITIDVPETVTSNTSIQIYYLSWNGNVCFFPSSTDTTVPFSANLQPGTYIFYSGSYIPPLSFEPTLNTSTIVIIIIIFVVIAAVIAMLVVVVVRKRRKATTKQLPTSSAKTEAKERRAKESLVNINEESTSVDSLSRGTDNIGFIDQQRINEEQEHLDKLRQIIKVSESLAISRIAKTLEMDEEVLWKHIFDWAEQFGFKIKEDVVIFGQGNTSAFIDELQRQFDSWDDRTKSKDGKI